MPIHPSKILSLYLIGVLVFWVTPGFCAQGELTELQKQARAYRAKGYELQKRDNLEEAFTYYQKAALLDPAYVVAYNDLGVIFEAQGLKGKAKEMYLEAIEIDPAYPNSYSNLALLYEEAKDYDNAILYWVKRRYLRKRRDPGVNAVKKHLEELARLHPEAYYRVMGVSKAGAQVKEEPKVKNPPEGNRGFLVKNVIPAKPPKVESVQTKPQEPNKEKPKKPVKSRAKAVKRTPLQPQEPSVTEIKKEPQGQEAQEGNRGFFIKNSKPTVLHKAILNK